MAKQLNVNLAFSADTSQAKAKVQELQSTLMSISSGANLTVNQEGISQAITAAKELQVHLNNAFNANTGKLDLSKLNQSLNTSKANITQLSTSLLSAGDTGKEAFVQLAQSIAAADRPMLALNGKLAQFGTVLKNTAGWQISSSLLHGFIGTVQSAYNYAKDLNRSLNDIRIVTGLSADEMSMFAVNANKAAKSLSTTTNEYAKASLVYFQQGLRGQDVEDRANVTMKMANVSRQSAQEVSDQLTAIWNNFYDGSETLESYADKMVALGAATASSSDEIAGGLEKFAAIGDTIGLSFDYAAGALATITANTRESEEVVGTALKTIFARIQGLKLGETLEDGVELNKYSEALRKVGVDVLDAQNNLIDADDILERTAEKWKGLSDAEQTALAQTVAGIRQYNQFIALMDNWDDGTSDSMVANLKTIEESGGALQQQADLYEESWEAASNRVRASLETIYTDVMDDDFFIDITNGFAKMLDGVHEFIQGAGGIKTLFIGLGSVFLSSFAHKIQPALAELRHDFSVVFQGAQKQAQMLSQSMNQVFQAKMNDSSLNFSTGQRQELANAMQLNEAKTRLNVLSKTLTQQEQQRYNTELAIIQSQQDEAATIAKRVDSIRQEIALLEDAYDYEKASAAMGKEREQTENQLIRIKAQAAAALEANHTAQNQQAYDQAAQALDRYRAGTENAKFAVEGYGRALYESYAAVMRNNDGIIQGKQVTLETSEIFGHYISKLNDLSSAVQNSNGVFGNQITQLKAMESEIMMAAGAVPGFKEAFENALNSKSPEELASRLTVLKDILSSTTMPAEQLAKILRTLEQGANVDQLDKSYKSLGKDLDALIKKQTELNGLMKQFKPTHVVTGIEKITQTAAGLGQVAMVAQSVRSIFNAWNNDDMTFGEKLTTTFMGISMIVPGVIGSLKSLNAITGASVLMAQMQNAELMKGLIARAASKGAIDAETLAKQTGMTVDQAQLAITTAQIVAKHGSMVATTEENAARIASIVTKKLGLTVEQQEALSKLLLSGMTLKQAMAEMGLTGAKTTGITATIAATLANMGLSASLAALIASVLVFTAVIGGLALIIWGVVKAYQAWKANTIDGQIEAAREASEGLNKALDETKQKVDDLKSSFDNYDSVVEKLANCTKGTEEWKEVLKENNDQVLELMDKFPELASMAGAITIGKDGQLTISEDARNTLIEKFNDQVGVAARANTIGKQTVRQKEIEKLKIDRDDLIYMGSTVIGEYANTSAKKVFDAATRRYSTSELDDAKITEIIEALKSSGEVLKDFDNENLIEQVYELMTAEEDLANAIRDNTAAIKAENYADAAALLADDENYQKSNYKDNIATVVGANGFTQDMLVVDGTTYKGNGEKTAEQLLAEAYSEKVAGREWGTFGANATDEAEQLFWDYIEAKGMKKEDVQDLDFRGDGAYFKKRGEDGTIASEETKLTADEIGAFLAAEETRKGAKEYGSVIAEQMNSFSSQDQADIFTAKLTGDESFLTPELLSKSDTELNNIIDTMQLSEKTLKEMGLLTKDLGRNTEEDIEKANKAFREQEKQLIKQVKAFDDLSTTYQGYIAEVKKGKKEVNGQIEYTEEAEKAADGLAQGLRDAFGGKGNWEIIDADFVDKNQQLIEDFMNGVEGSADELRKEVGKEIWVKMGLDSADFDTHWNNINTAIQNAYGMGLMDLEIGATINDQQVLDSLSNMMNQLMATGYTAEQAGAMIVDSMGIEVEVDEETETETDTQKFVNAIPQEKVIKGKNYDPILQTETDVQYTGVEYKLQTATEDAESKNTVHGVKVKNAKKVSGGDINRTRRNTTTKSPTTTSPGTGSAGSPSNSGNNGGNGNNRPKKVEPTKLKKKNDEVERYHEINEELEDLQNSLDEIDKLKEDVWGADRLALMDKEKKKLQEITKAHEQYQAEIAKNLNDDRWEAETKYGAIIDPESGRITNYQELQEQWMNEWNAKSKELDDLEQQYEDKIAVASEDQKETLEEEKEEKVTQVREDLDEEYEEKRKALEQYEETLNLSEEAKRQLDDYFRQVRELNYESLEYTIEIRVEVNERDIEDIEHRLERLGDTNIYSTAERLAMYENTSQSWGKIAQIAKESVDKGWQNYLDFLNSGEKEGISLSQYTKTLQSSRQKAMEAETAIREGIQGIGEELINAFDLANEKFDQHYTKIDSLTELMEHYKNVVSLTEGEASFGKFNNILRAQQKIIEARINSGKEEAKMWGARRQELEAHIETLKQDPDYKVDPEYLAAQEALNDVIDKENEVKSQIMADIEQLGEYAREIFENAIEQAAIDFEEAMFGESLNSVIESLDMLNAKQEEILTTTNKLYETNKLLRDIEKDIGNTANLRAKQAYNEFAAKVKQKQEQNQLSKFELDLLTAEYEITKAQIALEEAQNAKNQVRLSRDSEGNYGYVYTANQDNIAEAEQALDDATNNYYNTALEGAQKYENQIYQHIQEWEEKVKEVYLDQTLSEEEKNKKIREINDVYNTLIKQDKELYYTAVGAIQESAYNTQVDYELLGIDSAERWFVECDGFIEDMKEAQKEYDANTETVAKHTEENFGNMEQKISDTDKITNQLRLDSEDLAGELDGELKAAIGNAKDAWTEYLRELEEVLKITEKLMRLSQQEDEIATSSDYAQSIIDEFAKGEDADLAYIARLAQQRDKKMQGIDLTDYQAILTDETLNLSDAQRKGYEFLREHKLAVMEETDYSNMLREYITSGGSLDDQHTQNILKMRALKSNLFGLTDVISNEELVSQIQNEQAGKKNKEEEEKTSKTTSDETSKEEESNTDSEGLTEELINELAKRVANGEFGNGRETRLKNLQKEYSWMTKEDYEKIQNRINGGGIDGFEDIVSDFSGQFIYPLDGKARVSSNYGMRNNKMHHGIDLAIAGGTPILAAADGVVARTGYQADGAGNYIVLSHGNGYETKYFHASKILASKGQKISAGDTIALVGTTGSSTGNHLHFEIRKNGTSTNPKNYLAFDTGGYTGNWGPEGKLAMLHEKELVLNKYDTENFLSATQILREISQSLDNNALAMQLGLFNLHSITANAPADQVLQQEVTIHADFPNVTDHNEIEQAVDNLINAASQYAYRNNYTNFLNSL